MEAEKQVADLLVALGGIAEMLGQYKKELTKNGFTKAEAVELCKELQKDLITLSSRGR